MTTRARIGARWARLTGLTPLVTLGTLGGMNVDVQRIAAAESYPLRQAVLRPHQRVDEVAFAEDDDPATATFAAIERPSGQVVGVTTVFPDPAPFDPAEAGVPPGSDGDARIWRLRGMAVREDLRGSGVGQLVLDAALDYVAAEGCTLLWCNARVTAAGFYERSGFQTRGDEWVVPLSGPHVLMWRRIVP
jgi:GNAT superfamily N-acetyltransferase